jgi:uncharacterized protein (UPF0128 family)
MINCIDIFCSAASDRESEKSSTKNFLEVLNDYFFDLHFLFTLMELIEENNDKFIVKASFSSKKPKGERLKEFILKSEEIPARKQIEQMKTLYNHIKNDYGEASLEFSLNENKKNVIVRIKSSDIKIK